METAYYNLSGGLNQSLTNTELGSNTKRVFWSDCKNVEIYKNRGIIQQKGNTLFLQLPLEEKIVAIKEITKKDLKKLFIATVSGRMYIYNFSTRSLTLLSKTLTGTNLRMANFLDGLLVNTESDSLFFIKNNHNYDIIDCNLVDDNNNPITDGIIAIYAGRVWVAKDSTIYYSALGTYDNFTEPDDAGYIRDFYTKTDSITALKPYRNYLAIYKSSSVYLLSGDNQENFKIEPIADMGTSSAEAIVNVQNRQYFLSLGIFPLEEIGELNQIRVGSNIAEFIKLEFDKFDYNKISNACCIHYAKRNQIWYFIPQESEIYLNKVYIYDYENQAWSKRVIPQKITCSCLYDDKVLTADENGSIYIEDTGTTFNGLPIEFMWKSPFFTLTSPHKRKLVDEFYFLLDDERDNKFRLSVFKDYDGQLSDDVEEIYSIQQDQLYFGSDDTAFDNLPCFWGEDNEGIPIWAVNRELLEKAEISGSNYSVQICIEGYDATCSCAIIGLQFREIYLDE